MQVVGVINAYQEEDLLPDALESFRHVADRVVVVDGAYRDFPRYDESTWGSTDKTVELARAAGAEVIEAPADGWRDEIEKRNAYIRACKALDWLLVIDADERVIRSGDADQNVPAAVRMDERYDWIVRHYRRDIYEQKRASYANHMTAEDAHDKALEQATMHLHRCFAWRPGLAYVGTHHALHVDGVLIHPTELEREGPSAVLPGLMIEHVQAQRDTERMIRKNRYYERLRLSEAEYRAKHSL